MIAAHLNSIENTGDLCARYENIIQTGDINSEMSEDHIELFCNTYNKKCLVKEPLKMLKTLAASI